MIGFNIGVRIFSETVNFHVSIMYSLIGIVMDIFVCLQFRRHFSEKKSAEVLQFVSIEFALVFSECCYPE